MRRRSTGTGCPPLVRTLEAAHGVSVRADSRTATPSPGLMIPTSKRTGTRVWGRRRGGSGEGLRGACVNSGLVISDHCASTSCQRAQRREAGLALALAAMHAGQVHAWPGAGEDRRRWPPPTSQRYEEAVISAQPSCHDNSCHGPGTPYFQDTGPVLCHFRVSVPSSPVEKAGRSMWAPGLL